VLGFGMAVGALAAISSYPYYYFYMVYGKPKPQTLHDSTCRKSAFQRVFVCHRRVPHTHCITASQ